MNIQGRNYVEISIIIFHRRQGAQCVQDENWLLETSHPSLYILQADLKSSWGENCWWSEGEGGQIKKERDTFKKVASVKIF